jgi:hypothetical protein
MTRLRTEPSHNSKYLYGMQPLTIVAMNTPVVVCRQKKHLKKGLNSCDWCLALDSCITSDERSLIYSLVASEFCGLFILCHQRFSHDADTE